MKIRTSFVSNSSSSSFILIFDRMPKTVESLMKMLDFSGLFKSDFSNKQYAAQIFKDIKEKPKDNDLKQLLGDLLPREDWVSKICGIKDPDERARLYKEHDEKTNQKENKELKAFKKKYKGKVVRIVSYSDNDGSFFCNLEHGGLFDNIEHFRISHH